MFLASAKKSYMAGLLAAVVLAGFLWWAFMAPAGTYLQLYDRKNEAVILEVPIQVGDQLQLEIEHSFEHIPWYEFYTVTEDLTFNLDKIAVAGYGAGIPAEMDVETYIEDGLVWMVDINSVFDHFQWITSAKYMKVFQLNGSEIFDFRSLPDASKVSGNIIVRKGHLDVTL